MAYTIGVDIGGSSIKAGLVSDGKIIRFSEVPTKAKGTQKDVLENIVMAISNVMPDKGSVRGIGLGCPGPMDIEKGIVYDTANLPFKRASIVKYISGRFNMYVMLENDANAFTKGEAMYGSGKNYRSVFGITLGTGVGGGIVLDGKIEHGRGNAAEVGHMMIDYNGRACNCGRKGCLEAYASNTGVISTARSYRIFAGSAKEVYDLAMHGRKDAIRTFEKTGKYLGAGIANVMNLLDPDIIIIGGGIAGAWGFFSRSMIAEAEKRSVSGRKLNIVGAKLEHPGVIGAASLFGKG